MPFPVLHGELFVGNRSVNVGFVQVSILPAFSSSEYSASSAFSWCVHKVVVYRKYIQSGRKSRTYKVSENHGCAMALGTKKESSKIENATALTGNLYHNSKNGMSNKPQNGISGAMLTPITNNPQPIIFLCMCCICLFWRCFFLRLTTSFFTIFYILCALRILCDRFCCFNC